MINTSDIWHLEIKNDEDDEKLRKNEDGATAIEYGLIAALIAIAIIGGASALGGSLDNAFNNIAGTVDTNT